MNSTINQDTTTTSLRLVVVGHVDHGKSTIIGRLLADTDSLPKGKLDQVKAFCEKNSRPFEYAYLLDALKDEQAQGITIDIARCFFKTAKRKYLILDAPGHIEFLKNMITGAANAEAALLVIDANEGVQENSRRHGYMLSMLGIKQIIVLVNKMDLIDYDEDKFRQIVKEYEAFLKPLDIEPILFIPVSGMQGDNIANHSSNMPWYVGETVLKMLDSIKNIQDLAHKPFRMPVQDVYKFTRFDDGRRIIAGKVESGGISVGDQIIFFPSGKTSEVASIEGFNVAKQEIVSSGYTTGLTLKEQVYIKRGEVAVKSDEKKPQIALRIKVSLFWLGKKPLVLKKNYFIKIGTAKVKTHVESFLKVMDSASLAVFRDRDHVCRHEIADCILWLSSPIAFDSPEDNFHMSRFVIIDQYDIAGGGIILEGLVDERTSRQQKILSRNYHWITSDISREERMAKYQQKPLLVMITGEQKSGRKALARSLEKKLVKQGYHAYYLGIGNVVYGVDADIDRTDNDREEHLRRFAEVLNILLDAGQIVIVTALSLTQEDVELIQSATSCDNIVKIWSGNQISTNIQADLQVDSIQAISARIKQVSDLLQQKHLINGGVDG